MYQYDKYDQTMVEQRVEQYRDQTRRFLAGELTEEQFRPLRLMNGLYIQIHAPMLRVAIPYGLMSSQQVRKIADVSRRYDKGFVHFTTRQNFQMNWPKLEDVPDILAELATVQMHAIQSSGNCIRNTTSDQFAGINANEIEDPRPWAEIIRQWSTFHPEFAYLPRKFKIAVIGSEEDRAATKLHDIGLHLVKNHEGEVGFEVLVGGGLGRTPIIGQQIRPFLEKKDLLSYLEAILRVYNRLGRRDNKYKARIKITVREHGINHIRELVEAEWVQIRDQLVLDQKEIDRVKAYFTEPEYDADAAADDSFDKALAEDNAFARWAKQNTFAHKQPGYRAVYVSLKAPGVAPGDVTSDQLDVIADLADEFSLGEVRSTHTQNLVFADVKQADLYALWLRLEADNLATPNVNTLTDIICCPGLDYCGLANAKSIPLSKQIAERFGDLDYLYDLGDIKIKFSGCMNGCAHQSVGHIGILGVDKKGEEWYQFTLGGSSEADASLGERLGKAIPKEDVVDTVGHLLDAYVDLRHEDESFLATVRRLGIDPFKERVYADN
ncbi:MULTISPECIES: nitrite/sulfite reductase [Methylophaga]|jgi:sulfite reductase (NADPH) hemoprotein beta-component|uniref:Nitrite/sulfite reductase n=1 Tax=Methylophaga marina TaxID=45495 RepID=A0ABP3CQK5_9GAMM|nr:MULTISPECIES: nitrite/sulfite reductase [Methylophaga]MAX53038.1 sulfite reductase [Methylophaga sp.]BDZ73247.1 sulfite reductase [Methylophaga marina]|tara:strand:+ start:9257 stop:10909 length:1653 start_codon:yes stop_codon:yes gene_type:complete